MNTTDDAAEKVPVVEVDDPSTWPPRLLEYADAWANRLRGTTKDNGDLKLPFDDETVVAEMLAGRRLQVLHCTRLLDSEVDDILTAGLAPLSRELLYRKLDAAAAVGALTPAERHLYGTTHVYAQEAPGHRDGLVCFVVGRSMLDRDFDGLERFLTMWGGEATYWAHDRNDTAARLRELGRPAVMDVALDVTAPGRDPFFTPGLHKLFVGARIGLEDAAGEGHIAGPVRRDEVVDVWQPGHPEYDRHTQLPR
jgi:hypothetical protein